MKTSEQLAEEYVRQHAWTYIGKIEKQCFLAGYQAAKDKYEDRIKELEQAIIQSVDAMAGVKYDDENT